MSVRMEIKEKTCKNSTWAHSDRPIDCKDAYDNGKRSNGVYRIYPKANIHGYKVYCDMTTDGGGWTVIQKRFDGSINFYRTWKEYRNGFGNVTGEYWLGNEKIHLLTTESSQVLRIDMMDESGTWKYATYTNFSISSNATGYKLYFETYQGNAGDSLGKSHKGQEFKTKDKPGQEKCPITFVGAWWYNGCHSSNLNGQYGDNNYGKGLNWYTWRGYYESLKRTEMKIRRE